MTNHRRLPVHVGDEERATRHLTPAQYGCFARLRMAAWSRGGLDPDPGKLARLAGARIDVWKRLAGDVLAMFTLRDGLLVYEPDDALRARQRPAPVEQEELFGPPVERPARPVDKPARSVDKPGARRQTQAARIHNGCGLNPPEKPREIKGRARAPTRAAPDPIKNQNPVGTVGDSALRARASPAQAPPGAAPFERAPPGVAQFERAAPGLGPPAAGPPGRQGLANGVISIMGGRKPAAASLRRGGGQDLAPLAEALARLGRRVGERGG